MFQSFDFTLDGLRSYSSWFITMIFVCLTISGFSQSRNCAIEVKTEVIPTQIGKATGQINLTIDQDDRSRYKVFVLNQGPDKAKSELKDRKLKGLSVGFYEFIIIDVKGDKCYKELTVKVQNAN